MILRKSSSPHLFEEVGRGEDEQDISRVELPVRPQGTGQGADVLQGGGEEEVVRHLGSGRVVLRSKIKDW